MYDLLCNNPLAIGDGKLELKSYTLHAKTPEIDIDYSAVCSIFVIVIAYILFLITDLGGQLLI